MDSKVIRIAVIPGSVRPNNYTHMAANLVVDELKKDSRVAVDLLEPGELHLPFPGENPNAESTKLLQAKVAAATGIVLVTPEYHGSFSSVMKLVIENLGFPSVLAGKPVALVGVAAGSIGAIKSLEHLRGVVSHIGAFPLPMPVSIPNVQRVFDSQGRALDPGVESLVRSAAMSLLNYIKQNICPRMTLERILREGPGALEHTVAKRAACAPAISLPQAPP
jgi:NAD(P)H-dependent FMN reductase